MAEKGEKTNQSHTPYKDPLFIVVNENAGTALGSITFDGNNFLAGAGALK